MTDPKIPPVNKESLLRFLTDVPSPATKREIAQAFNITGDDRVDLKALLRELEDEGAIIKYPGQKYGTPEGLPGVAVLIVTEIDIDGDVLARPEKWNDDTQGQVPRIEIIPEKKGHPALTPNDRVLARLHRVSAKLYEAKIIRQLDGGEAGRVMGRVERDKNRWLLTPANRKTKDEFEIVQNELNGATHGDLALCDILPSRGLHRKKVKVVKIVGRQGDVGTISLIALHEAGLREEFPQDVIHDTDKMTVPDLKGRDDLRPIPLVTIDGADARDFDDAVYAEKTDEGFHLIVAIADVAHYVRSGGAIDKEAFLRGNSTYFADRVLPMLPERLSNDLCSLRPNENRACMAVHLWIDRDGNLLRYKFVRGLMRSAARLTYEQVQAAKDGVTDDITGVLLDPVIKPLYEAYKILWVAREKRGALDLDLPERQILVDKSGKMTGVKLRDRLDSHKLIEEFMILANVAAASALEDKKAPCVYRVHDRPDATKLDTAREFVQGFGLSLPKGQVLRPAQINEVLHKAEKLPFSHLVSEVILRCQAQAHYDPENIGHFGLALKKYAHFTSPIRRYADLLVHRSLIRAYDLGDGGLDDREESRLEELSQHISATERASMMAERNSVDRFTAAWLSERIGAEFSGRIRGVTRHGLFVELAETGADGFVPARTLPRDQYVHDERQHALIGRHEGRLFRMGAPVRVKLLEADGLTGSTVLALVGNEGADVPGLQMTASALPRSGKGDAHRRGGRNNDRKHYGGKPKHKGKKRR
jgi:ribonuclease R